MNKILIEHFRIIERVLIAKSKILKNTEHAVTKGTVREIFIKEFLQNHLSETLAIGSGHIIDCNGVCWKKSDKEKILEMPQLDIVIYKKDYPKLHFINDINLFLAESVIAAIEVKSVLNSTEFKKSVEAANKIKKLHQSKRLIMVTASTNLSYSEPTIMNYIVAYECKVSIKTVYKWMQGIDDNPIDGIFILGKGCIYKNISPKINKAAQKIFICKSNQDSLAILFFLITKIATEHIVYNFQSESYYPPLFAEPQEDDVLLRT